MQRLDRFQKNAEELREALGQRLKGVSMDLKSNKLNYES